MFKITLKGIRAHKIRFLLTTVAVIAGVAFVVGSFTLTDSVRSQFNQLFTDINANIDLTVRTQGAVRYRRVRRSRPGQRGPVARDPTGRRGRGRAGHCRGHSRPRHRSGGQGSLSRSPAHRSASADGDEPSLSQQLIVEEGTQPDRRRRGGRSTSASSRRASTTSATPSRCRRRRATASTSSSARSRSARTTRSPAPTWSRSPPHEAQSAVQPRRQVPGDPDRRRRRRRCATRCNNRSPIELPDGVEVVPTEAGGRGEPGGRRVDHRHLRHRAARVRRHLVVRRRLPDLQRVPDRGRPASARAGAAAGRRRDRRPGRRLGADRRSGRRLRGVGASATSAASSSPCCSTSC